MDVQQALESRFSTRDFKPDPVDQETILKILKAATRAPSWADTQPWEIFVAGGEPLERLRQEYLDNLRKGTPPNSDLPAPKSWPPALKKRMEELMAARFGPGTPQHNDPAAKQANMERNYRFFGAPAVIYLCMDRNLTSWSVFDLGMLAQSIMLAATEAGLSTIPAYTLVAYPDLIRAALQVPEDLSVIIGIAIGYADPDAAESKVHSPRRPIQEVVRFRGF